MTMAITLSQVRLDPLFGSLEAG